MNQLRLYVASLAAVTLAPACLAAEVDARPPDRITLSGSSSSLRDIDEHGGGASLNYLHYFTPDAVFGVGGEYQYIADSSWEFGALRGSWSHGDPSSRFTLYGEVNYGNGDDNGRDFDYEVEVLGISQSFTSKFFVQLEGRYIDIDTSYGNLPKLGLTYVWSPHLTTSVSYANSVSGNLGTELYSARVDYYGSHVNLIVGGAGGTAASSVVNLQPGLSLPSQDTKEAFVGIGKTFARGELLLLGDYLEFGDSDKVTLILSVTAYLGSRGSTR
jgi:hypothetical protein